LAAIGIFKDSSISLLHANRLLRVPVMTIILAIVLVVCFFRFKPSGSEYDRRARAVLVESGFLNGALKSLYEFCNTDQRPKRICVNILKFYSSARAKLQNGGEFAEDEFSMIADSLKEVEVFLVTNRKYQAKVPTLAGHADLTGEFNSIRNDLYGRDRFLTESSVDLISLLKAQFTHDNLEHLLGNLLALLLFGLIVESWLGATGFLIVYLIGGTLGLFFYAKFFILPGVFVIGASANIGALIGAYLVFYLSSFTSLRVGRTFGWVFLIEFFYAGTRVFYTDASASMGRGAHMPYIVGVAGVAAGFILAMMLFAAAGASVPKRSSVRRVKVRI
jgi:membrane associated rhomboid family serine protease